MTEKNKCYLIVEVEADRKHKASLNLEDVTIIVPGASQAKVVDVSPFYPIIPYERAIL